MKASELRDKSVEELGKELLSLHEEQFKLRMQRATGQLGKLTCCSRANVTLLV